MEISLHLGQFSSAYSTALEAAVGNQLAQRIWQRDHTVWNPAPTEISNRLGWLDIAERMQPEAAALTLYARTLQAEGITHALLLGMGGSSLAPEVYSLLLGSEGVITLGVVDSTDPEYIEQFAATYDPTHTLYIVSTKSGGTVETLSLFKYFYNQAQASLGAHAGRHFIAITDPGSSLATLAEAHKFRSTFLADPNIGGRYSALSHFGLVPAALLNLDLGRLLAQAQLAASSCQLPDASNPGLQLGVALATLAQAGRDKLTFFAPAALQPFGDWAEQLIAESTGKHGQGILPVVAEPLGTANDYGNDRVFVALGEQTSATTELIAQLQAAGQPVIELSWDDEYSLGAQYFLWEFATAVAGHALGIQPFDQPDVESAKVQGRAFVDEYTRTGTLPDGEQQPLSAAGLQAALADVPPNGYIALQAYAAPNPALTDALQALRGRILHTQQAASTLGYGPRFLHSTGQLHKGDAGNGVFIQFVTEPPSANEDLSIPDAAGQAASSLSFGVLKAAQALGDAAALRAAGRRVVSFAVTGNLAEQLRAILKEWA